jgi:transcriptional regulator with XRE-family HTH domain
MLQAIWVKAGAMSKRTVTPNAEAIQRLRLERGWRIEDLATQAKCSDRTVVSIENGANAYIYTISKIARALQVEMSALLIGEKPPPQKPKERVWEIRLTVSTPYEDFDETRDMPHLLQALMARLGGQELEPKALRSGSTEIRFDMPIGQIVKLIEAYKDGHLDDLGIMMILVPNDFGAELSGYSGGGKARWQRKFAELVRKIQAYQRTHREQTAE